MKVIKRNVPVYYDRNKHFNAEALGLVQDIFQHQSVGLIGYVTSRRSCAYPPPARPEDTEAAEAHETTEHLNRFDLCGLGEYEKRIISRLISGRYRTNVLRGDMGSGKSSTIDYLIAALKRPRLRTCGVCEQCIPIIIKLDFNEGHQDDDIKALIKEFRQSLYDQLKQVLRQRFKTTNLTDALRNEVIHSRGENKPMYATFDSFVQAHEDNIEWDLKANAEKANLLFSYVDERTSKGTENLAVIMKLVYLTKVKLLSDPACLILIFDNIDSVTPQAQFKILAEILSYQHIAQVQSLVTLRRATFGNFEDNRAAYTFGPIDHAGPDIKEVIIRRLTYYDDNWDSLPEVKALTNTTYRQAVRDRLKYLLETKDDARGGIQRVASICGASIRQGLHMCERFFINSAVPFNETPRYKDDIVRAVLVATDESNEISPGDRSIVNLLLNKATGEASLLNIRILQLIVELDKDEPNRTVRSMINILQKIGGWSKEEVRVALNYLLYIRRPLIWVDGRAAYDRLTIARHGDDVLHLTESGYFYLRDLMRDLVYVQEAALSVKWKGEYIHIPKTIDYSKVTERFEVLRCFLVELATQDYNETHNLKRSLEAKEIRISVKPILFINRVIAALGKSALNILLQRVNDSVKHETDEEMKLAAIEELRNWRSLINEWYRKESLLVGFGNKKLRQLSHEYRSKVPLR